MPELPEIQALAERLTDAVAGAHLPFPGFGRLERGGQGFQYRAET